MTWLGPISYQEELVRFAGRALDLAGLLGSVAASSLSNVYYPAANRGVEPTFKRVATGIPFSVMDHLIDEFGPDLEKKVLRKK